MQNTKQYFLAYLPTTILTFLALNRLFHCLSGRRVSLYFRAYSFMLQLWFIAVLQNLNWLWFFCLKELQVLFSLSYVLKFIRFATVPIIGLIFVDSVCLFLLYNYMHTSVSGKYFRINIVAHSFQNWYMLIRFVLKPFIETSVHVFFLDDTKLILQYLCVSEFATLVFILICELALRIHENKQLFVIDCLVESSLICLNLVLLVYYCKMFNFFIDEIYRDVLESLVYTLLIAIATYQIAGLIIPLLKIISFRFFVKFVSKSIKKFRKSVKRSC